MGRSLLTRLFAGSRDASFRNSMVNNAFDSLGIEVEQGQLLDRDTLDDLSNRMEKFSTELVGELPRVHVCDVEIRNVIVALYDFTLNFFHATSHDYTSGSNGSVPHFTHLYVLP